MLAQSMRTGVGVSDIFIRKLDLYLKCLRLNFEKIYFYVYPTAIYLNIASTLF